MFLFWLIAGAASRASRPRSGRDVDPAAAQYLPTARALLCARPSIFGAARYAFAALENESGNRGEAYAWISMSLVRREVLQLGLLFFH